MIDEDAFGILFSYCEVEVDEYGVDDPASFVERFQRFEQSVLEIVARMELPGDHRVLCFGHAVYVEFRDSEPGPALLSRFRQASAELLERGYVNSSVLTYGGRWVEAEGAEPPLSISGSAPRVARLSLPSEPLRRALDVETLARPDEEQGGWGPGVYVDVEALSTLGRTPKNAPTVLHAKGAEFFRLPPLRSEPR